MSVSRISQAYPDRVEVRDVLLVAIAELPFGALARGADETALVER